MKKSTPIKLPRKFYDRPTLDVARDLIGKYLVYRASKGRIAGKIVEVEAYVGSGDPACHAARGKTQRNAVMFGPPGHAYVYFIYGMYHCLNFVTERAGVGAAVLLRAAQLVEGESLARAGSPKLPEHRLLSGPGVLCRSLGVTRDNNGLDLTGNSLYLEDRLETPPEVTQAARIGITNGQHLPWRFFDCRSESVSRQ